MTFDDGSLVPTSAPGSVGASLDRQVITNHLKRALRVTNQDFSRWTFGELKKHTDAFANGLINLRLSKGDKLAISLPANTENVVALFAAAKLGITVVPLPTTPSRQEIEQVLSSGVQGLIFNDISGETDYGSLITEIVPEVPLYAHTNGRGLPFRSDKYPHLRHLINIGRTRIPGMTRYAWIAMYRFDDGILVRQGRGTTPDTPFLFDNATNKVWTQAQVVELAKRFPELPSNAIVLVAAELNTPQAFAAACVAPFLSGAMTVFAQPSTAQIIAAVAAVDKPQVLVADRNGLQMIIEAAASSQLKVDKLVLVEKADQTSIASAKAALSASDVITI